MSSCIMSVIFAEEFGQRVVVRCYMLEVHFRQLGNESMTTTMRKLTDRDKRDRWEVCDLSDEIINWVKGITF